MKTVNIKYMQFKNSKLHEYINSRLKDFFLREDTFIGRQKQEVLLYCTPFITLSLVVNLLGIVTSPSVFPFYLNIGYLLVVLLVFVGYYFHRLPLNIALKLLMLSSVFIKSTEIIYHALFPSQYGLLFIVAYTMLQLACITFSLFVLLRSYFIALSLVILAVYFTAFVITGEKVLLSFLPVFFMAFLVFSILGRRLLDNINKLLIENTSLKNDEMELLFILKMKKEQIKAYSTLVSKEHPAVQTEELFYLLNDTARRNIISNVTHYLRKKATDLSTIEACFPELTPSERDICRLILQNKKLGEICAILNKTETNINSQRAHIRKKLGLQTTDNLKKALQQRMKKDSRALFD